MNQSLFFFHVINNLLLILIQNPWCKLYYSYFRDEKTAVIRGYAIMWLEVTWPGTVGAGIWTNIWLESPCL